MSDRKKRALSGILAGTSGSAPLQIVTLIVTPLYLNLTSQELFGLWLTLAAILGWIKIGDMGLGMALTRRAVEAFEQDDYLLLKLIIESLAPQKQYFSCYDILRLLNQNKSFFNINSHVIRKKNT